MSLVDKLDSIFRNLAMAFVFGGPAGLVKVLLSSLLQH